MDDNICLDYFPQLDNIELELDFFEEVECDSFNPNYVRENIDVNNNIAQTHSQQRQDDEPPLEQLNLPVHVEVEPPLEQLDLPVHVESLVYDHVYTTFQAEHYLGLMSKVCSECGAKLFEAEISVTTSSFEMCCRKGKVYVDLMDDYPMELERLFTQVDRQSVSFIKNLRSYNSALAMGSIEGDFPILPGRGVQSVVVHGQIYHNISPLFPNNNRSPKYGQLYVLDADSAALARSMFSPVRLEFLNYLSHFFATRNILAMSYRMMGDVFSNEQSLALREGRAPPEIRMSFVETANLDLRRYNSPTTNEVAIVYRHAQGENDLIHSRTLTVYSHGGGLTRVNEIDKLCDPISYPIFYPLGTGGWHPGYDNPSRRFSHHRISQREYYAFLLFERNNFNAILYSSRLFHQFSIDAYIKVEASRLNFFKKSQKKYRFLTRDEVEEAILFNDFEENSALGRKLHLPSSFVGGPSYMHKSYQDAIRIMGKFGKPDFFITMTANPQWVEIQENLFPNQTSIDRPDLIARVFRLKWKELMKDIKKNEIFGKVAAVISVFEWQKRGLPHAHILITLHDNYKIKDAAHADKFIFAYLPDKTTEPLLYERVKKHMVHRRCCSSGAAHAPCSSTRDGRVVCSKKFPKPFSNQTVIDPYALPIYKRPDDGSFVEFDGLRITNQYIVPFNPFLLKKFNCHINFEYCGLHHAIKYLYKYIYKGHDCAKIQLECAEEISAFFDARYMCAPEAIHRLLGFEIEHRSHTVVDLHVHLPTTRYFRIEMGQESNALQNMLTKPSTLEAWFNINRTFSRHGFNPKEISYLDFPIFYTFDKSRGWKRRLRKTKDVIGRIQYVSPKDMERYALRLILLNRKGMCSYEECRTVDGVVHLTFKEAAIALNLLEIENPYRAAFEEAIIFQMPRQLRGMFASLLPFSTSTEMLLIWNEFNLYFAEDYMRNGFENELAISKAYFDISDIAITLGIDLSIIIPLPSVPRGREDEYPVDYVFHENEATRMQGSLNVAQRAAFDQILSAIIENRSSLFYIDGPGGSGKTYLYNTLCHTLTTLRKSYVCTAYTGIAAQLLPFGKTCHSLFKLPFNMSTNSVLINKNCKEAELLRQCDVIIWDEFSMISRQILEFVDETLRFLMNSDVPFGGKTLICGGDYRQILPIVDSDQIASEEIAKCSNLWRHFITLNLSENVRVSEFTDWANGLLQIGNGDLHSSTSGFVNVPASMLSSNIEEAVFGNFLTVAEMSQKRSKCILATSNTVVDEINMRVLQKLEGNIKDLFSIDTVIDENPFSRTVPSEFLNTLSPPGYPPSHLKLKIGSIVMLLRNLNLKHGLANGTRLLVTGISNNILRVIILTGPGEGSEALIPKIGLICDQKCSVSFKRVQFPVKLSFAMTINKSQGQTFETIGIHLLDKVFSHGQLYVALSRCKSPDSIYIKSMSNNLFNIVEKSVLR